MGPLKRLIGSFIFFIYRGGREGARRRKALKDSPKPPTDSPKTSRTSPKAPQSLPKSPQRLPQSLPESPKASQRTPVEKVEFDMQLY